VSRRAAGLLAKAFALGLLGGFALGAAAPRPHPSQSPPGRAMVELNANARAEGNRRADAVDLGRHLLATIWPAQILKVRVDGVGPHEVAGLMVSGVKFHGRLDDRGFSDEIASLVKRTFASSRVEEVDIWAVEPIPFDKLEPVSGDYAEPTDRIVFSITVRRNEKSSVNSRLKQGKNVFWAPDFHARLHPGRTREGPLRGSPNPTNSPPST
jgi:hypothetical protein